MQTPSTPELDDAIQVGLAGRDRENMGPTVAYFVQLLAQHPGNASLLFEVGGAYDTADEEQQALGY